MSDFGSIASSKSHSFCYADQHAYCAPNEYSIIQSDKRAISQTYRDADCSAERHTNECANCGTKLRAIWIADLIAIASSELLHLQGRAYRPLDRAISQADRHADRSAERRTNECAKCGTKRRAIWIADLIAHAFCTPNEHSVVQPDWCTFFGTNLGAFFRTKLSADQCSICGTDRSAHWMSDFGSIHTYCAPNEYSIIESDKRAITQTDRTADFFAERITNSNQWSICKTKGSADYFADLGALAISEYKSLEVANRRVYCDDITHSVVQPDYAEQYSIYWTKRSAHYLANPAPVASSESHSLDFADQHTYCAPNEYSIVQSD
ncbi:hypothetical protein CTAYLR_001073 [Chrysophaeum taylorii]|uniref:Uncharacterized protein n=1 Tax=Chrysophaeum taylorii TaxID=2483200 RepID=A0AAD7UH54_9STRA|nr:hypothetical protein CTAYLR_001073 [Chrysophaeum taylorii]